MYRSLSFRCCSPQCCNKHIYGSNYQYLLFSNYNYYIDHTKSYKSNGYNSFKLRLNYDYNSKSIRSFATNNKKNDDDSYLELDKEEDEDPSTRARKWKTKQRQTIGSDSIHSTSESNIKTSRWDSIKSVVNKPFSAVKNKLSRDKKKKTDGDDGDYNDKPRIQKEKMVNRPGKKSLPSPDQGVMTFIPKHKAQILHILQEECNIFPDEVFPLFPDNKTEEILAGIKINIYFI